MGTTTQLILLTLVTWVAAGDLVIDVSHHNGHVDWRRVKAAGVGLAIAKATEGQHYRDDRLAENWRGIKENNMAAGAYHYLRGGQAAGPQVQNIKSTLQSVGFDAAHDMLVVDVEEGNNNNVSKENMAETLKGVLEGLGGEYKNLWIYTGPSFWENKVAWRNHDFSGYKLWIAHYTSSRPIVPSTWRAKGYSLWQYTDRGRVDGVSGNVDMSRVQAAAA